MVFCPTMVSTFMVNLNHKYWLYVLVPCKFAVTWPSMVFKFLWNGTRTWQFWKIKHFLIFHLVKWRSVNVAVANLKINVILFFRLTTIAVSDFICWFPVGLLGLLAYNGLHIPGELNVAVAIFVLPFNAAFNPFLYTFNVLMEKRRKRSEDKLMKLLENNYLQS